MSQIFDPLNLLILAIAIVIFWRLGSLLGRRTGNERPPFDPYSSRDALEKSTANGKLADARPRPPEKRRSASAASPPADSAPVWEGYAAKNTALAKGLEKLAAADADFEPRSFIEGAKTAYEIVISAFARGDKQALKPLLSAEVMDGFSQDIDRRGEAGEKLESSLVGIVKTAFVKADVVGRKAVVTLRFVSELISARRNKSGEVIDGDDKKIREITDVWTFERDVGSSDPNWTLVATESPA
ncbi:MAG: Tim44/TimA family putative adaptor protein [Pseudomonadota bacterium]|nr:Tim44/TimA family putative adaptor protein [Pseudomonadota bacterium]